MERAIEVGRQSGYIKIPRDFIRNEDLNKIPDHKLTILVTAHKEPFAA